MNEAADSGRRYLKRPAPSCRTRFYVSPKATRDIRISVTGLAKEIWGLQDRLSQGQEVDADGFLDDEMATADAASMNRKGVEG